MDDDGHVPDAFEKGLRFGCGFVFGALMMLSALFWYLSEVTSTHWAIAAAASVVSGLLAVRYGEQFWRIATSILKWW